MKTLAKIFINKQTIYKYLDKERGFDPERERETDLDLDLDLLEDLVLGDLLHSKTRIRKNLQQITKEGKKKNLAPTDLRLLLRLKLLLRLRLSLRPFE